MGRITFGCCFVLAVSLALINGDEVCYTSDLRAMKVRVRQFTTETHGSISNLKKDLEALNKENRNQEKALGEHRKVFLDLKNDLSSLENVTATFERLKDEVKDIQNRMENMEHLNCTDKFPCNEKYCIMESWKCDGKPDCPDGRDESNEFAGCDRLY